MCVGRNAKDRMEMERKDNRMKERDPYIDILKAIGIISIVIGHASINIPGTNIEICKFVYAYHLMIFFFTAGFCFKKEYAAEPYQYIGRRLKSMLPLYFKYNLIFVLLHNLFVRYHFVDEGKGIYGIQVEAVHHRQGGRKHR